MRIFEIFSEKFGSVSFWPLKSPDLHVKLQKNPMSQFWEKLFRSRHQRCSAKKGALRNFAKFTGKHLRQCLFFNKVADLRPATLLRKRLWRRSFPVNFVKFLRTPFLQDTSGRLLLAVYRPTDIMTYWQVVSKDPFHLNGGVQKLVFEGINYISKSSNH